MNNFSREPKVTEQVTSKATKPDESRKKSLYFLLLAIGRQIAASKPDLRTEYREALNSLEIQKSEESWILTLVVGGKKIERTIQRSEFRFYSTGLTKSEDNVVESNKRAAIDFWNSVESEMTNVSDSILQKKIGLRPKLSTFETINITAALQVGCIIVAVLPTPQKILPFFLLAFYPIVRLFWHSSKKILILSFYITISIFFAISIEFSTFSQNQGNEHLLHGLLIFLLWSEYSRRKIQVNRKNSRSKILILLMAGLQMYLVVTTPNKLTIVLICLLILSSEALQYIRKSFIHDSHVVIASSIFEITLSLVAGLYLLNNKVHHDGMTVNEILVFIFAYLLWFIYLNIFERYPIAFRITYPFLIVLTITNQDLSLGAILMVSAVISSVILISGDKGPRSRLYE